MNMLGGLPGFLAYLVAGTALLAAFLVVYVRITPYREFPLIREGNVAASISLLGALLGFTLPLASAIAHSVSLPDMLAWGGVALFVQASVYLGLVRWIPEISAGIPRGEVAHGLFLGGASLAAGILNAACMTY